MEISTAVILAAGKGDRLRPYTSDRPKCMVDLGGTTALELILDSLKTAGIQRVVVVTGYHDDTFRKWVRNLWPDKDLIFVFNEFYESRNNIYSAFEVQDYLRQGCLLLNSDIVFHPAIIPNVLKSKSEAALVIENRQTLGAEEMKVYVEGTRVVRISKQLDPGQSYGEYTGIALLGSRAGQLLADKLSEMIGGGEFDKYYEHAIDEVLDRASFEAISTQGMPFTEFDTVEDLIQARRIAQNVRMGSRL